MQYECRLASIDKLTVNELGVMNPLCTDCKSPDCSNPIKELTISQFGIPKKVRLYSVNNMARMVIACQGYIGDKPNDLKLTGKENDTRAT